MIIEKLPSPCELEAPLPLAVPRGPQNPTRIEWGDALEGPLLQNGHLETIADDHSRRPPPIKIQPSTNKNNKNKIF